jgi:hypothetical protein
MTVVEQDTGFAQENDYLSVYIPSQMRTLVFRVKRLGNVGYHSIPYGSLPIMQNTSFSSYDGLSVTVPEAGVIPARSYTSNGLTFPLRDAYDANDMFFTPKDYADRLVHAKFTVEPNVLRLGLEIPRGLKQYKFQRDKILAGVDRAFGFSRGSIETVFIPELRYGLQIGNDTNIDFRTNVNIDFSEYVIEIPTDPELIYNVLVGKVDSYIVGLPVSTYDASIANALRQSYGFEGFDRSNIADREKTIAQINSTIKALYGSA